MLLNLFNVVYVLVAIGMIVLILLQRGAGAQAGSGFGGGASGTVFGARGAATFLSRSTAVLAGLFFLLSLVMGDLSRQRPPQQAERRSRRDERCRNCACAEDAPERPCRRRCAGAPAAAAATDPMRRDKPAPADKPAGAGRTATGRRQTNRCVTKPAASRKNALTWMASVTWIQISPGGGIGRRTTLRW